MFKFLSRFVRDESGAAAAEYVLALAILGGGIAATALYFGQDIKSAMKQSRAPSTECARGATTSGC